MVVARFEPVAALRELLHVAQQIERAEQQVGEVEHRVRVERAPVLGFGNAVHPEDAARDKHVQIAFVAGGGVLDGTRMADDQIAMDGPHCF